MTQTGIQRIDDLFSGSAGVPPIGPGDSDIAAVGALQDLLIGHGARLPGILDHARGKFGPRTEAALRLFQQARLGRASGCLDGETLHALATSPARTPIAAQSYVTLALSVPWTGFTRLVGLTAQFEAAGKFTAQNRNTDRAGLSFGIIQWAQRPGRLGELLVAFERAQPVRFVEVLGGGSRTAAFGLLTHTTKPSGGVTALGRSTDPAFDLTDDRWNARFAEAGRDQRWQQTQLELAISAFQESCAVVRRCAPVARSERAIAFLIDVANQHGNAGLRNICARCEKSGLEETDLLEAVEDESVRRLELQFGEGSAAAASTRRRRNDFRTSPLLSDDDFLPS